jgi:hypothetical protein
MLSAFFAVLLCQEDRAVGRTVACPGQDPAVTKGEKCCAGPAAGKEFRRLLQTLLQKMEKHWIDAEKTRLLHSKA